jgi:hypothetical protein
LAGGELTRVAAIGVVVASLALAVPNAFAADQEGNFAVKGIGLERCERYVAEKTANSQTFWYFLSWLNGYLTAYNQYQPETYDITPRTDVRNLAAAFETYCTQNPKHSFLQGAISLTRSVAERRSVSRPAPVDDQAVRPAALSREAVRQGQQALRDQGFYTGNIDGVMGPGTSTAIKAFQKAENLAVTGNFDRVTLARLLSK